MGYLVTIDLAKENMKFSAGHFTIFSATERERLHGHNFRVAAAITCEVGADGLAVDYGILKDELVRMCRAWNEIFLLPARSPHLEFEWQGDALFVRFAEERIPFLRGDVLLLPLANVTVEELARLVLEQLLAFLEREGIDSVHEVSASVFSGPGQSGTARWFKKGERSVCI